MNNYKLPFYAGELGCGLFGITEEFVENYLSLDEKFMKNRESTFFVRSGGDSMLPEIKNEDILVVDRSLDPVHESIIAVFYNGNPLCKQLLFQSQHMILHSFNSKYQDIFVQEEDEIIVFGVVIGLAREFI